MGAPGAELIRISREREPAPRTEKPCTRCGEVKPLAAFNRGDAGEGPATVPTAAPASAAPPRQPTSARSSSPSSSCASSSRTSTTSRTCSTSHEVAGPSSARKPAYLQRKYRSLGMEARSVCLRYANGNRASAKGAPASLLIQAALRDRARRRSMVAVMRGAARTLRRRLPSDPPPSLPPALHGCRIDSQGREAGAPANAPPRQVVSQKP